MKNMLAAGMSAFAPNKGGLSAYEAAMAVPELKAVFSEACAPLAERAEKFNPKTDALLDAQGRPTDLLHYCCHMNRLGAVLATTRWNDVRALVQIKHTLKEVLPASMLVRYEAELESSAARRGGAAGSDLLRRLHNHGDREVG